MKLTVHLYLSCLPNIAVLCLLGHIRPGPLVLDGTTWLVLANKVREGIPFQAREFTLLRSGTLAFFADEVPSYVFWISASSLFTCRRIIPSLYSSKTCWDSFPEDPPLRENFFSLRREGRQMLVLRSLSCTENTSYELWNHSIIFPLFIHPSVEFSYNL